jgi:class 3 adenylate cyclase
MQHARDNLASIYLLQARWDEFDANYEDYPFDSYPHDLFVARRLLLTGDVASARKAVPSMRRAGRVPPFEMMLAARSASLLFPLGEEEEALERAAVWRAHWEAGNGSKNQQRPSAFAAASEWVERLDDPALAEAAYREAVEWRDLHVGPWTDIGLDRAKGRFALAAGLIDQAEEHCEAALEWARREHCPIEEGSAHVELAEIDRRRGKLASALEHLERARTLFADHEAPFLVDRVIATTIELQGGGDSDSQTSLVSLTTSIEEQRPDVASAVAPDGTVTLLFSDIEDSTAMNVELGDDAWMQLLGEHNRLVREAIREHGGFEVKTEGDAFMVAFQSARDAVRCAQAMQRALDARSEEPRLRIRIGLHTGEPIREAEDFYGTHVVLASRICSQANGGEILVSALLRDLVAASGEFELSARDPIVLKGLDGEHVTYAVAWA